MDTCAKDSLDPWVPAGAVEAMSTAGANPTFDDGHTDCYYAGILRAAIPHMINAGWRPPEEA
jgi:hypothetical protein